MHNLAISKPRYKVNVNNYERLPADVLELNDVGSCNIALDRNIPFDPRVIGEIELPALLFSLIEKLMLQSVLDLLNTHLGEHLIFTGRSLKLVSNCTFRDKITGTLAYCGLQGSLVQANQLIANIVEKNYTLHLRHTMLLDAVDTIRHAL